MKILAKRELTLSVFLLDGGGIHLSANQPMALAKLLLLPYLSKFMVSVRIDVSPLSCRLATGTPSGPPTTTASNWKVPLGETSRATPDASGLLHRSQNTY